MIFDNLVVVIGILMLVKCCGNACLIGASRASLRGVAGCNVAGEVSQRIGRNRCNVPSRKTAGRVVRPEKSRPGRLAGSVLGESRALNNHGQATKGARGMSWCQEALKGVEVCEKSGGIDKQVVIPEFPNRLALNP